MQDNELTGDLSAYAADLSGLELPSATRFFSVGGNQLTGVVSEEFQKLGAFLPGSWNILDGLLFSEDAQPVAERLQRAAADLGTAQHVCRRGLDGAAGGEASPSCRLPHLRHACLPPPVPPGSLQ